MKKLSKLKLQYEKKRKEEKATIKYHRIFRFNYEKFLLPMHDIYEIIMFSSTNPTASRIQSNRDNMNFSSLCFPESAFYVTRLYAFWIFFSFSCGKKSLSELREASFSPSFHCKNEKAFSVVSSTRSLSYVENFRF